MLDHQFDEMLPGHAKILNKRPWDYFRDHFWVTYWFESVAPKYFLDAVPLDNVLFETDFPHTTCLFGNIQETIQSGLGHVSDEVRQKILWENAASLYNIVDPPEAWRILSRGAM